MKTTIAISIRLFAISVLCIGIAALLLASSRAAEGYNTQLEKVYEQWKEAVVNNPILTEPMLFRTNTSIKELDEAVIKMRQHRFAMAKFLCDKFASQKAISYWDANLLAAVAQIDLFHAKNGPIFSQNIGQNMRNEFAIFKKEWNEGIYKDPSKQIASLCQEIRDQEAPGNEGVAVSEIHEIRRYGVFGIPALIEEVKQHDSKHAFAALLMALDEPFVYSGYLKDSKGMYPTKADKLNALRQATGRLKSEQEHPGELWTKISQKLAE